MKIHIFAEAFKQKGDKNTFTTSLLISFRAIIFTCNLFTTINEI
jgi:hypothetical protein